jgi:putative phosphoesterase
MKLGLLSDSHDNLPALRAAARTFQEAGVAHVIHAGDFVAPFSLPPLRDIGVPVTAVYGNNDGERVFLARRFAEFGWDLEPKFAFPVFGTVRVAVHHEPEPVEALAASGMYDIVVYGHTHALEVRRQGEVWVINPGEVGGWLTGRHTIVIVDLETVTPSVVDLDF